MLLYIDAESNDDEVDERTVGASGSGRRARVLIAGDTFACRP